MSCVKSFDLGCHSQEGNRFAGKEAFLQQLTALAKQGVHPLEARHGAGGLMSVQRRGRCCYEASCHAVALIHVPRALLNPIP